MLCIINDKYKMEKLFDMIKGCTPTRNDFLDRLSKGVPVEQNEIQNEKFVKVEIKDNLSNTKTVHYVDDESITKSFHSYIFKCSSVTDRWNGNVDETTKLKINNPITELTIGYDTKTALKN